MSEDKTFALVTLPSMKGKGKGQIITDTDLWGLCCALEHAIQSGYFKDNPQNAAWSRNMINKLNELRR